MSHEQLGHVARVRPRLRLGRRTGADVVELPDSARGRALTLRRHRHRFAREAEMHNECGHRVRTWVEEHDLRRSPRLSTRLGLVRACAGSGAGCGIDCLQARPFNPCRAVDHDP